MRGRVSVLGIAALAVIAVLMKPGDGPMGRYKRERPASRYSYKCRDCGHVFSLPFRERPAPACERCGGRTKSVTRRRQG